MKSPLRSITFGIILFLIAVGIAPVSFAVDTISANKKAALVAPPEKEVIIQVAESNEKNLPAIRASIEQAGGMRFMGYCKDLKVLLYRMDTDMHHDLSFLNVAFVNVSMGYLLKEGTFADVQNVCNMPVLIDPNLSQD
jgi:hypothetical protein